MTPIITPAPKRSRRSGLDRLQIDIPSADVKREQRKRRQEASEVMVDCMNTGLSVSPSRTDMLCFSVPESKESPSTEKDDSGTIIEDRWDDSDYQTLSSSSSVSSNTSLFDADGDMDDFDPDFEERKYLNRIIDFDALKSMIESRCVCSQCNGTVLLTEITVGVATTVVMTCTDCDENSRRTETGPAQVNGHDICQRQGIREKPMFIKKSIKRFIDFPIHYSLVLLMQQLGCGLEGIRAVLSHLSLTDTIGDWEKWRLIMDAIGTAQQQIANDCMLDNIKEEVKLSQEAGRPTERDSAGSLRQGLTVSIDMGWQKRSSGNRYDSPSGVSLMIGALSKTILQRHVCGKLCSVCAPSKTGNGAGNNTTSAYKNHRCPLNYSGTSKGMEASAAVECVRGLYHATTNLSDCPPAFVDVVISDDDSSTWANLQQSMTLRLKEINDANCAAGLPLLTEKQASFWPKNRAAQPKKDYGKLSLDELPPRTNLADPNHRTKVLGKHLYPLTTQRKDSGKRITKPMAERLKLHFGKALHQNRKLHSVQLERGLRATLEHEFGDHTHCSDVWCRYLRAEDDETRLLVSKRWMNKEDDRILYNELSTIYNNFLTPDRIEQMYHDFDTQKNESMNNKIARMCPKHSTLSKTMVLSDRVAWVVIEDSIGGAKGVISIYKRLQLGDVPPHLVSYYMKNDKRRIRQRLFKLQPHVKHRRRKALNEKIWADRREHELSRQKGQTYDSGVAFGDESKLKKAPKSASAVTATCPHCGLVGHSRTTSKKCLQHKNTPASVGGDAPT